MQVLLNSDAELRINYILFKIDVDGENVKQNTKWKEAKTAHTNVT